MTPWLVLVTLSLALLEPGTCFHERFGRNMRGDTMYNVADAGNIHTENLLRENSKTIIYCLSGMMLGLGRRKRADPSIFDELRKRREYVEDMGTYI